MNKTKDERRGESFLLLLPTDSIFFNQEKKRDSREFLGTILKFHKKAYMRV
jgi:hypothetical protein